MFVLFVVGFFVIVAVSEEGLAASLQEHIEGVDHALTQVSGAAGRQQGAEFEGFGHPLLVDVRQHVLIFLATQDDLGVIVVKVDLWKLKKNNVIVFLLF